MLLFLFWGKVAYFFFYAEPGIAIRKGQGWEKRKEGVIIAERLTDKKKKQIIADFLELGNYSAVGRKHGVADKTVKRLVEKEPEMSAKVEEKKRQNSKDILAHMDTKKDKVNEIIDVYLEKLLDEDMLSRATPSQLTTALGTLIDKFTMAKATDAVQEREDDALTKALKEEAERMQNADK